MIKSSFSCWESDFIILNNSFNLAVNYKTEQIFWTSNKIAEFTKIVNQKKVKKKLKITVSAIDTFKRGVYI